MREIHSLRRQMAIAVVAAMIAVGLTAASAPLMGGSHRRLLLVGPFYYCHHPSVALARYIMKYEELGCALTNCFVEAK